MGLNGIVVGFCRNIMGFHGHWYVMDFYRNVLGFNVKIKGYFIANSNYISRRSPGWSKSWGMGNFGLNQRVVSSSNMGIELGCVTNDLVVFKICLFVQIVWTLDTVRLIIKQGTNFSSNWSLFWGSPPLIVRVYKSRVYINADLNWFSPNMWGVVLVYQPSVFVRCFQIGVFNNRKPGGLVNGFFVLSYKHFGELYRWRVYTDIYGECTSQSMGCNRHATNGQ